MENLIKLNDYPIKQTLIILLQDKTTRKNIIFATDAYTDIKTSNGTTIEARTQITEELLLGLNPLVIQPRVSKTSEEQTERTDPKNRGRGQELLDEIKEIERYRNAEVPKDYILRYWNQYMQAIS